MHSFVVFHRVYEPTFAKCVPYVVAVIELDEGPRMLSNVVDVETNKVRCGMRVAVKFDDVASELSVPRFAPVDEEGRG